MKVLYTKCERKQYYTALRGAMGNLTKNFDREEFMCKCGHCDGGRMDDKFMSKLQALRDLYGKPMMITSGFRCATHNKSIGGVTDSKHMKGIAVDIAMSSAEARYTLIALAIQFGFTGIGIDHGFIHLDTRVEGRRLWSY